MIKLSRSASVIILALSLAVIISFTCLVPAWPNIISISVSSSVWLSASPWTYSAKLRRDHIVRYIWYSVIINGFDHRQLHCEYRRVRHRQVQLTLSTSERLRPSTSYSSWSTSEWCAISTTCSTFGCHNSTSERSSSIMRYPLIWDHQRVKAPAVPLSDVTQRHVRTFGLLSMWYIYKSRGCYIGIV